MAGEADQNPLTATESATDNKSDSETESDVLAISSSAIVAAIMMEDNQIPEIPNYRKKSNVSEANHQAYHDFDWLTSNLISSIPEVGVSTTHDSTMVCFESHLVAGLGLPPIKFLVVFMNFLECELVQFNPNAITALTSFTMLCEC
jgi:hypothetical protein